MMSKKKILICSHALHIGGAERSLLDLLYCLDYKRVDVDLFLYRHDGVWLNQIPMQVHLLPEVAQYSCLAIPMTDTVKKGHYGVCIGRMTGKILAYIYDNRKQLSDSAVALEYSHKYTLPFMPQICPKTTYDLAISFLTPHYFVAKKVHAKKKIAWIHTDYKAISVNGKSEEKMWNQYDYIASISDNCTESFTELFPSLKRKILKIENVLAEQLIINRAGLDVSAEIRKSDNQVNALSIGRFSYAKNFDQVPEICFLIRKKGINLHWYIIGYGDDTEIIQNIRKFEMGNYIHLLGLKENPYPYIRACDVYIQPSRYEGKSVTVREAQILHKPVIITNYATSDSQLENGVDGIIVPLENELCAESIVRILNNKALLQQIVEGTKQRDYSNRRELNTLYSIMESVWS